MPLQKILGNALTEIEAAAGRSVGDRFSTWKENRDLMLNWIEWTTEINYSSLLTPINERPIQLNKTSQAEDTRSENTSSATREEEVCAALCPDRYTSNFHAPMSQASYSSSQSEGNPVGPMSIYCTRNQTWSFLENPNMHDELARLPFHGSLRARRSITDRLSGSHRSGNPHIRLSIISSNSRETQLYGGSNQEIFRTENRSQNSFDGTVEKDDLAADLPSFEELVDTLLPLPTVTHATVSERRWISPDSTDNAVENSRPGSEQVGVGTSQNFGLIWWGSFRPP
ncbi:hypothetical protein R1flu_026782 [Riccia fluitans]|uniref:Uncharacterized protein n=1 Tax=Riccia fluitans TaxID=41844 RepID=A0ABD1XGX7_9MARC